VAARRRLILEASDSVAVMLNLYPYNSGHLMIAPRRHVASPELMTAAERAEAGDLIARAVAALRQSYKPAGINIGANLGRAAGASFADHMHWHLVPRWEGDNNFMPAIGGTRVLPETLEDTFLRLKPLFKTGSMPVS
jgi:ATP adenylyltransferase